MVSRWGLSDCKSLQVFGSLLSILADLNSAAVWVASICPLIFKSSCPCINPLVTVPRAPVTISITDTFSIPWQGQSTYLSFCFLLILFCGQVVNVRFFLFIITKSGHLVEIRWSVCISKSHRSLYVSFSRIVSGLCIYHLFLWANLHFLHNSKWINLITQSCLVLYSFCASLLHSLIMWLITSFLSPHNLHLLVCCHIYSCFDMIDSIGVVLSSY